MASVIGILMRLQQLHFSSTATPLLVGPMESVFIRLLKKQCFGRTGLQATPGKRYITQVVPLSMPNTITGAMRAGRRQKVQVRKLRATSSMNPGTLMRAAQFLPMSSPVTRMMWTLPLPWYPLRLLLWRCPVDPMPTLRIIYAVKAYIENLAGMAAWGECGGGAEQAAVSR